MLAMPSVISIRGLSTSLMMGRIKTLIALSTNAVISKFVMSKGTLNPGMYLVAT